MQSYRKPTISCSQIEPFISQLQTGASLLCGGSECGVNLGAACFDFTEQQTNDQASATVFVPGSDGNSHPDCSVTINGNSLSIEDATVHSSLTSCSGGTVWQFNFTANDGDFNCSATQANVISVDCVGLDTVECNL